MKMLREGLPPVPFRMLALPIEERGYPVPFFVAFIDGKPDFRVVDPEKLARCVRDSLCWLCGHRRGRHVTYAIGPMCAVNRVSSEPPSHYECARFAAMACPFLTRPKAQRRDANLPDGLVEPAGFGLDRNPGVALLWSTKDPVRPFRAHRGAPGLLFDVGEPESVEFYAEGRPATYEEIVSSLTGGCQILRSMAAREGPAAQRHLEGQILRALALVRG